MVPADVVVEPLFDVPDRVDVGDLAQVAAALGRRTGRASDPAADGIGLQLLADVGPAPDDPELLAALLDDVGISSVIEMCTTGLGFLSLCGRAAQRRPTSIPVPADPDLAALVALLTDRGGRAYLDELRTSAPSTVTEDTVGAGRRAGLLDTGSPGDERSRAVVRLRVSALARVPGLLAAHDTRAVLRGQGGSHRGSDWLTAVEYAHCPPGWLRHVDLLADPAHVDLDAATDALCTIALPAILCGDGGVIHILARSLLMRTDPASDLAGHLRAVDALALLAAGEVHLATATVGTSYTSSAPTPTAVVPRLALFLVEHARCPDDCTPALTTFVAHCLAEGVGGRAVAAYATIDHAARALARGDLDLGTTLTTKAYELSLLVDDDALVARCCLLGGWLDLLVSGHVDTFTRHAATAARLLRRVRPVALGAAVAHAVAHPDLAPAAQLRNVVLASRLAGSPWPLRAFVDELGRGDRLDLLTEIEPGQAAYAGQHAHAAGSTDLSIGGLYVPFTPPGVDLALVHPDAPDLESLDHRPGDAVEKRDHGPLDEIHTEASEVGGETATALPRDPGRTSLSARESQVADLVAEGLTNDQVARRLGISRWTVVNHLRNVMRKLDCMTRVEVATFVARSQAARPGRLHDQGSGAGA